MKVVASIQLRLAMETEEVRRVRLENDADMDEERKARLEKTVASAQSHISPD